MLCSISPLIWPYPTVLKKSGLFREVTSGKGDNLVEFY